MSSSRATLMRIVRLGHVNFWRNRWLTLGATLLMTLTLTMISVSVVVSYVVRDTTNVVRDKIGVTIYFRDDTVPEEKILALKDRVVELPNVVEVVFISKKQALEIFQRLPINEDIKSPVDQEFNPLPRSLEVRLSDPDRIEAIQQGIQTADQEKIICSECLSLSQNKEVVNQLIQGTRAIQQAGWLLSLFFGVIAIVNVLNIIRLTIAARSDEIEIMRYVGASNSFIRGPFVVEGMLYGILGTVLTSLLLPGLVRIWVGSTAGTGLSGMFSVLGTDAFSYLMSKLPVLIGIQLALGVGVGVLVSLISIRRYLKA